MHAWQCIDLIDDENRNQPHGRRPAAHASNDDHQPRRAFEHCPSTTDLMPGNLGSVGDLLSGKFHPLLWGAHQTPQPRNLLPRGGSGHQEHGERDGRRGPVTRRDALTRCRSSRDPEEHPDRLAHPTYPATIVGWLSIGPPWEWDVGGPWWNRIWGSPRVVGDLSIGYTVDTRLIYPDDPEVWTFVSSAWPLERDDLAMLKAGKFFWHETTSSVELVDPEVESHTRSDHWYVPQSGQARDFDPLLAD